MSQAATELSSSKMSVPTEEGPLEIKITTHDFGLSLDDATFGTHTQNAQQASSEEQAETGADASSNIDIGDRTTLLRKNPAHDLAFLMGLHSRLGQESVLVSGMDGFAVLFVWVCVCVCVCQSFLGPF